MLLVRWYPFIEWMNIINNHPTSNQIYVRPIYISIYQTDYREQANRARRIINRSEIKLDDYIGTGDKSFTVAG